MKNRLLIIQTAFIGDAILTLPMIQKLKELEGDCNIDVVAIPSSAEIFKASPSVSEVLIFDKRGKHASFGSIIKFARELRSKKYSKLFSPHRSFRTSLLVLLSEVRDTYGFDISAFNFVYKNKIEYRKDIHEVQRNLSLIGEDIRNKDWKIKPEINADDVRRNKVAAFISQHQTTNFIAVAPGSVWNTKKYPPENFIEVIKKIIATGLNVILIGSEKDFDLCEKIQNAVGDNVVNSAGKFDLIETAEMLKHAKLLICNDSAPTHLGMSAGIPVLTLYCSTVADFGFYPYNSKSRFLSFDDLDCKPCGIHGYKECPIKTFDCGYKLLPSEVFDTFEQMISK